MTQAKTVLVTGATGKQGGAVARELLRRGHRVRGFTRNPTRDGAEALRRQGAEVFQGDFDDRESISRAARGADAVFIMGTPFEGGADAEVRQSKAVAETAAEAGVKHLVYTSVASADRRTGIPHFDSKWLVELHLADVKVPYTVLAPVFFFENFAAPNWLQGVRQGVLAMALPPDRRLQSVSVSTIGEFAAMVIERGDEFHGKRIELASDDLSGTQYADELGRATGRSVRFEEVPLDRLHAQNPDFAMMFDFFQRTGYQVAVESLSRDYPEVGWIRFADWAGRQDWRTLLQKAA